VKLTELRQIKEKAEGEVVEAIGEQWNMFRRGLEES
jgi:hypothetical protein